MTARRLRENLTQFGRHSSLLLRIGRDFSRRRSCMMFHPLRNSDCDLQRDQTSRCASVSRPFGPMLAVACLMTSSLLCGCASGLMTMPGAALLANRFSGDKAAKVTAEKEKKTAKEKFEDGDDEIGTQIKTPLLSEYISVQGNTVITLRGVGLVVGLNRTGGDPAPSALRTQLQNESLIGTCGIPLSAQSSPWRRRQSA